jgi:small-conductance mechanosensitive channel
MRILVPMSGALAVINHDQWVNLGNLFARKAGALLALVVIGLVVQLVIHRLIDRLVRRAEEGVLPDRISHATLGHGSDEPQPGSTRRVQRAQTMGTLLKSITSGIIVAVILTMMLSEVGLNIGPIIASAGIVGVALGFGSQTLVKDFLSGIFMIFEDQYGVGDVVNLGEATGTVEAVGLRVTRLRDVEGTVWYVRNGEILRVGNQSQNWARTVLDIPVALDQDLTRVQDVLRDVAHDLWDDEDFRNLIIEEPSVWGIQDLTPNWVVIRVTLKTAPLEQWAVAREMRQRVKIRFDHEGIELAHPAAVPWGNPA